MGTSATVGSVGINVRANVDGFQKDLDKATKSLKDLSAKEFKIGGLTADKSKLAKIITDGMMDGFSGVFRNLKRMFENSLEDSIANKVLSGGGGETLGAAGQAAATAAGAGLGSNAEKLAEGAKKLFTAIDKSNKDVIAAAQMAKQNIKIRSPNLKDKSPSEQLQVMNAARKEYLAKGKYKSNNFWQSSMETQFKRNKPGRRSMWNAESQAASSVAGNKSPDNSKLLVEPLKNFGDNLTQLSPKFTGMFDGLNRSTLMVAGSMGVLLAAGGAVALAFNQLQDVAKDSLERFKQSLQQFASDAAAAGQYMADADLERKKIWEENLAAATGLIVIWEEFKTNISIVLSKVAGGVLEAFLSVIEVLYYIKDQIFDTDTAGEFREIIQQQIDGARKTAELANQQARDKIANDKKNAEREKATKQKKEKEKTPFTDLYKDTMYKVRETLMEQLWLKMGEMPPPPKPVTDYKMEALTYGSQAAIDAVASVGDKQLTVLQRIAKNTQTKADDAYTLVRW